MAQAYIFDNILTKGVRAGQIPARTADARDWFRNTASKTRVSSEALIQKSRQKAKADVDVGNMYLFSYDAKHKSTLPYFDKFPLIFKIDEAKDGFYGINLHYLPPILRAKLMDALYDLRTDSRYDENTKLKLSYRVLNGAAKYKAFKPCIKHYLYKQVKSRFIEIDSVEWDIALFLPLASFNASTAKVYADSRKMIS